ncbi:hypothetical protein MHBO_005009 [Bonamia ostreae]|uniref:Uncharacterized protein n=1 Tax=Bonamia ostreae TaxID=126728 RepID=A0ABV2AVM8_9EUKA
MPNYYEDGEYEAFLGSLRGITKQLGIPSSGVELLNNLKEVKTRERVIRHYRRQREDELTYTKHYR